jgi:hypothetical protein
LFVFGGGVLSILATLHCSPDKEQTKSYTPSSLSEIYSGQTVAALKSRAQIHVDRIKRVENWSSGVLDLFDLDEYQVVHRGRVLTAEEAERLRKLLLDSNSYTTMPYLCVFDPQFAFSLAGSDSTFYFVLANDCHLAAMQTVHSRQDVNLTEKTSVVLGAFCEALFQ